MKRFLVLQISVLIAASILLSACKSSNATPAADLEMQITQTMQAVATEAQATLQAAVPTLAPATNTPLPTEPPPPTEPPAPTATPVPAMTDTPVPTATSASRPLAYVNQNTNCRTGPAASFPLVYTALKGESLNIVSSSTLSDYIVVEVPGTQGQTCWLWTEYVTIQGDINSLPVANPPPTPTPSVRYSVSFIEVQPCTGHSLAFKVTNTGAKTLQSYTIVATDQTNKNTETTSSNAFTQRVNCVLDTEIGSLDPGQSGYIYENDFSYNPKGHSFLVSLTICSNNDMDGECASQGFFVQP